MYSMLSNIVMLLTVCLESVKPQTGLTPCYNSYEQTVTKLQKQKSKQTYVGFRRGQHQSQTIGNPLYLN